MTKVPLMRRVGLLRLLCPDSAEKRQGFEMLLGLIIGNLCTVFPRIVSAETILFWKLECGNYSREETINFLIFCMPSIVKMIRKSNNFDPVD